MKLFCVKYYRREEEGWSLLWAESRALAEDARRRLAMAQRADPSIENIKVREYDVPLNKRSIVGWLNQYFPHSND